jgi:hypothetical protein
MIVKEMSQPMAAYYLDGTVETFETVALALGARLGYAYPENVMVLVVARPMLPVVECTTGHYIVDFGGAVVRCTAEEFADRFQIIEN